MVLRRFGRSWGVFEACLEEPMTTDKYLKKRIRERMAKTGESYTSARANFLATEPAVRADAFPPAPTRARMDANDPQAIEELTAEQRAQIGDWIKQSLLPIASPNHDHTSYGIKHRFEKSAGGFYVTNGQFKGAMRLAGFEPVEAGEMNWTFCISKRSPGLTGKPATDRLDRKANIEQAAIVDFVRIAQQPVTVEEIARGVGAKINARPWKGTIVPMNFFDRIMRIVRHERAGLVSLSTGTPEETLILYVPARAFNAWLADQTDRSDFTGTLARDYLPRREWPESNSPWAYDRIEDVFGAWRDFKEHLKAVHADLLKKNEVAARQRREAELARRFGYKPSNAQAS